MQGGGGGGVGGGGGGALQHRNVDLKSVWTTFEDIGLSFPCSAFKKIIFGLLAVFFTYSLVITSLLPIFFMNYPFLKIFCDSCCPYCLCPFANYLDIVPSDTTLLPYYISATFRNMVFATKVSFIWKSKHIVLQILLFMPGSVELKAGPDTFKTIWNFGSLPVREFARIPLIEGLQDTYNFDIFRVCESMANKSISNEDIGINGFSPEPLQVG